MKRLIIAGFVALAFGLAACLPVKQPVPGPALVYGDSLIEQASPYLGEAEVHAYGGTALCDWVNKIVARVNEAHPRVVALSFIGNNFTPCMAGANTPDKVRAYYALAIADLKARVNVPLVWVLNPVMRDRGEPAPNPLYAAEPNHVDAGAAVEGPNGEYLPQYRDADGIHFNDAGACLYAQAITSAL